MQKLKRIRYNTMNSWNNSTAPAYNLKIYRVIDPKLQDAAYQMLETEEFYQYLDDMIAQFDASNNYEFQAGFNGRSNGYLVLYKGGRKKSDYKSICGACGQKNYKSTKESGGICGRCGEDAREDREMWETYTLPGQSIEEGEAPGEVLRRFRKLASDIIKSTEWKAKNCQVVDQEYTETKTKKILI